MTSQNVLAITDEISTVVREATLGLRSWFDLCRTFTEAFPGSYAALLNQNFVLPEVSFAVSHGLDEQHIASFIGHYCHINPWRRFWQHAQNGAILVPERDDPASQYRGSEFYDEWMQAVGDFDAAVGLRLQVEDDQIIYLPVHFSDRLSPVYERTLELVMLETRRSLINSLQIASYVRDTADTGAAKSALTAVVRATAFITDQDLRPLEANQAAVDAFRSGRPVSCRQGTVRFAQSSFTTRVLHLLRTSPADLAGKLLMRLGDEQWVVSVNQLPRTDGSGLIRGRRQFLIQIHKLAIQSEDLDDGLLVSAYGLTPSEVRLCRALAAGAMLPDAAVLVQISYENARQKLKSIFRKVGVSSQADLKSLLRLIA